MSSPPAKRGEGDLSVTALYTSEAWTWGGFDGAELLATKEAKSVFDVTNLVLGFVRLFRWDLPSLRHSLVQRHVMIDRLVRGAARVLELAAGLSRRGVSMSRDLTVDYVEVDLPPVMARKRELLARTEGGRAVLQRPNLRLEGADVRALPLEPLADAGTVVVAEGLFMYLKPEEQRALWTRVAGTGATLIFDLVPACEQPRPGLLGRALGWLMKRFTKGRTFEVDARTRDDLGVELRACGFGQVELFEPRSCPSEWAVPHLQKKTQVLVFRAGCSGAACP